MISLESIYSTIKVTRIRLMDDLTVSVAPAPAVESGVVVVVPVVHRDGGVVLDPSVVAATEPAVAVTSVATSEAITSTVATKSVIIGAKIVASDMSVSTVSYMTGGSVSTQSN